MDEIKVTIKKESEDLFQFDVGNRTIFSFGKEGTYLG